MLLNVIHVVIRMLLNSSGGNFGSWFGSCHEN